MNPLTGILAPRGDALGYRSASPNGDGGRGNQHFGVRHVSAATPPQCDGTTTTLHSPLYSLLSSYTFSAKEKDSETGLSYFGSRYYSSDLSIWLSVDPMASKYPSLSPYVYCADNPVKLVDPNGDSIINGYKEAYFYFLNQYTEAQKKLDAFGNDKTADGYNEAKIEYDRAAETYKEVSFLYKTVEVARSNVEKYNEELYNQMNSIENGSNSVDIRLYIDYSLDRYGNHRIPKQANCPSSINIFLNPNAKFDEFMDMGIVLSHELGHLLYIIPNWSDYQKFLNTVGNNHNGHNYGDESGKCADEQTQKYILNKMNPH